MRRRLRPAPLLLLASIFFAVGLAACSGDDDDAAGSPTPSPTTFTPVGCQVVWITRDPPGQTRTIDYYIVDAPVGTWVTGTSNFFQGDPTGVTNVTGAFVDDFDLVTRIHGAAMVATSGTFAKTLDATGPVTSGNPVSLSDGTGQEYFLVGTAGALSTSQGVSGTGHFDGTWSAPDSLDVSPGTGTVSILYQGSGLTMGSDLSYGLCYEAGSPFAALSRERRILEAGNRAADRLLR